MDGVWREKQLNKNSLTGPAGNSFSGIVLITITGRQFIKGSSATGLGVKMGDMAEVFNEMRKFKKERRAENTKNSTEILIEKGISFESKNDGSHLIVGHFDFWPSTGIFINRKTKLRGRGVFSLIERLEKI